MEAAELMKSPRPTSVETIGRKCLRRPLPKTEGLEGRGLAAKTLRSRPPPRPQAAGGKRQGRQGRQEGQERQERTGWVAVPEPPSAFLGSPNDPALSGFCFLVFSF